MQVKYIVYCPAPKKPPKVALWLTSDGSMTHVKYMDKHNIEPQSLSSLGYVSYSPLMKKYTLEHYQNDLTLSLLDLLKNIKKSKRDKILVRKEISKTSFLKDPKVLQGIYKDKFMFQKLKQR